VPKDASKGLQTKNSVLQSWASLITALQPETVAELGEAGSEAERLLLAGLRGSAGAEEFKRIFRKALDDAAKADQNLASLLLTTECECKWFEASEESKVAEY
jgi:ABC-type oligopeptide transport system substrate-binding subunit